MENKNRTYQDKKQKKEQEKLNICLDLIQAARKQRRMKALAVYYLLKIKNNNSCLYNYRSRMNEIAETVGICEKTLYNYFNHLRRMGLIYDHANNLMLYSTKKIREERKEYIRYKILIKDGENIETIEARLYAKLLEKHCEKINHNKSMALFVNRDRDNMNFGENENRTSISMRNLQQLFNASQYKTYSLIELMNELGIIKTTGRTPQIMGYGAPPVKYSREFPGYFYKVQNEDNNSSILYRLFGNRHELLEYPVAIKNFSLQQYLINYKRAICKI